MVARSLIDLEVVFLDCQTTGAAPPRAHLLEIAWLRSTARRLLSKESREAETATSRIVSLPEGEEIPRTIQRITGIGPDHLATARPPREVATELARALEGGPPLVIHYARFELPFLAQLAGQSEAAWDGDQLEKILCTHEVARRMLVTLPRRGLRALAGYFGEEVPELHRAGEHVMATAMVWAHLIELIAHERQIDDVDGLFELLSETPGARGGKRGYPMDRELRLALKDEPGIYRMINRRGDVIYLGKATSLKKRVNSYFQKRRHAAERTLEMLTQAVSLEVTATGSALEAAMLETDEIKRIAPRYNVALREDQRRVVYVSRDLLRSSSRRDDEHPMGPFSSFGSIGALGLIALVLRCRAENIELETSFVTAMIGTIFGARIELDAQVVSDALAMLETSLRIEGTETIAHRLLLRGARRWTRRIAERDAARANGDAVDQDDESDDETNEEGAAGAVAGVGGETSDATPEPPEVLESWTPELLSGALESVTEQAIHALRRSRWLRDLTDATLIWTRPKKKQPRRKIRLEQGRIVEAHDVASGQIQPSPPRDSTTHEFPPLPGERGPGGEGSQEPAGEGTIFDIATYDRLRVLTTEIRRLVNEGRTIELVLSPTRKLDATQLSAILRRF